MTSYVDQDINRMGSATPLQIRNAITARGRTLAATFAPGGIYREPSPDVEGIIIAESQRYQDHLVDHDGVTTQINVETAGMQSKFWIERANPGGIGAVDHDPDLALWFNRDNLQADGNPIPRAEAERRGIRAHIAKLLNYRFGEGPWTADDPRAFAVRQRGWMGSCQTWRDLKGKWATSPTYDTTMEAVWAALTRAPGGTVTTPYEHIIPGLVDLRGILKRNPSGRSEGRLPLAQKRGIVIHFNGLDVGADDRQHIINVADYHCRKDFSPNGSGAIGDGIQYHVGVADDGIAYLLRDLEAGLWHSGSTWNRHSLAVYFPIGINQRATPVQLARGREVLDAWRRFTGEGRDSVRGHRELSTTDCPGSLMPDLVLPYRAGRDIAAGPHQDPNARYFPETDKWLVNDGRWAMLDAWNRLGGVATCGYPLKGMTGFGRSDGAVEQVFENVLIEIYPNGTVRFGGLGMRYVEMERRLQAA